MVFQVGPSDMRSAMVEHLAYMRVISSFGEKYPDLKDSLEHREPLLDTSSPYMLVLRLDGCPGAVLHYTRFSTYASWPFWHLMEVGEELTGPPRIWHPLTPPEDLAAALHERALGQAEGRAEASPWKWDEADRTDVTDLADALTTLGLHVKYVLSRNRMRAVLDQGEMDTYECSDGEEEMLLAQDRGRRILVSRTSRFGWLVDVAERAHRFVWRMDLDERLLGEKRALPGIPLDRVTTDDLARALVSRLAQGPRWPVRVLPSHGPTTEEADPGIGGQMTLWDEGSSITHDPERPCSLIAHRLNTRGFTDVTAKDEGTALVSEEFHVVWKKRARGFGLTDLKGVYADAAVKGRPLLLVTDGPLTRPAFKFVRESESYVFYFDPDSGRMREAGGPAVAAALIPHDAPEFR